jgi:hypothetical protein
VRDFVPVGSPLNGPSILLFGPDGNLYVGDNDDVKKFDGLTGSYLVDVGAGVFSNPDKRYTGDLAFDTTGNLFISVTLANQIVEWRFDTRGHRISVQRRLARGQHFRWRLCKYDHRAQHDHWSVCDFCYWTRRT